jgi:hypothetical protein
MVGVLFDDSSGEQSIVLLYLPLPLEVNIDVFVKSRGMAK